MKEAAKDSRQKTNLCRMEVPVQQRFVLLCDSLRRIFRDKVPKLLIEKSYVYAINQRMVHQDGNRHHHSALMVYFVFPPGYSGIGFVPTGYGLNQRGIMKPGHGRNKIHALNLTVLCDASAFTSCPCLFCKRSYACKSVSQI